MINQEDLTPEQEELLIREELKTALDIGNALARMKKSPDFIVVFDKVFIDQGLEILWQNIRNLTEGQMIGRGSDQNEKIIKMVEGQIKTRLDFKGFLDTVENDRENAVVTLAEMDAADEEKDNA